MKQKNPAALAAWNLYPLTRDPAIIAFLVKNDGDDILAQARDLLEQSWQGGPDPALAAALQTRLIDYLWEKNDDESGEQGAIELLSALEALCRDLLAGGNRAKGGGKRAGLSPELSGGKRRCCRARRSAAPTARAARDARQEQ